MMKKLKGMLVLFGLIPMLLAFYILAAVVGFIIQILSIIVAGGLAVFIGIYTFLFYKRFKASP